MDYRPGRNAEGYPDPTACEAIRLIGIRCKATHLVQTIMHVAQLAGFRILDTFRLEDRNGDVFNSDELLKRGRK